MEQHTFHLMDYLEYRGKKVRVVAAIDKDYFTHECSFIIKFDETGDRVNGVEWYELTPLKENYEY